MKKLLCCILAFVMVFALTSLVSAKDAIPEIMTPDTVVVYDENCQPIVYPASTYYQQQPATATVAVPDGPYEEDTSGLAEEEAMVAQMKEDAKDLPVYNLGSDLPDPAPGMVVTYGSDGMINHIYPDNTDTVQTRAILPQGTRKPPGTYTYGAANNTITIQTYNQVLGEGRGTVFDDVIGDHDNYLTYGDCATKGSIDNPKWGTTIGIRNLEKDIRKDLTKNDVGSLPNAVIDIWQWSPIYQYFGEYYSPNLSFKSMRYWYKF